MTDKYIERERKREKETETDRQTDREREREREREKERHTDIQTEREREAAEHMLKGALGIGSKAPCLLHFALSVLFIIIIIITLMFMLTLAVALEDHHTIPKIICSDGEIVRAKYSRALRHSGYK